MSLSHSTAIILLMDGGVVAVLSCGYGAAVGDVVIGGVAMVD